MAILAAGAIAIHLANRYEVVENVSTVLVAVVTVFAITMVFLVQTTEFAWGLGDIGEGMRFQIAVGAGETTSFTSWCVEKAYAAWSGPRDGSAEMGRPQRMDLGDEGRRLGCIIGVLISAPLALVLFVGIANAVHLIGVAISTVYLSRHQTDALQLTRSAGHPYHRCRIFQLDWCTAGGPSAGDAD